jgi:hypothetical protein
LPLLRQSSRSVEQVIPEFGSVPRGQQDNPPWATAAGFFMPKNADAEVGRTGPDGSPASMGGCPGKYLK